MGNSAVHFIVRLWGGIVAGFSLGGVFWVNFLVISGEATDWDWSTLEMVIRSIRRRPFTNHYTLSIHCIRAVMHFRAGDLTVKNYLLHYFFPSYQLIFGVGYVIR